MVAREQFEVELKNIETTIIELAKEAGQALEDAVHALFTQDLELANKIIERDEVLDKKELQINEEAILLIAKEQPVARDLRRLIVAIKISSDLERMGDNATNIAKATLHLGKHDLVVHSSLKDMKDIAIKMIDLSTKAFEMQDITLARKLSEMDDLVDSMYGDVVREMLEQTATNPQKIQHVMQMAFSARFIERFADHTTNIGESILYLVKGESFDLNQ
ncbi:phosphate signaling complex protein PhoU [Radiobacillus deserti]|uniref:Phosphate-specific transport system accessory protein PhoU n=1 Tax=Radiobacillus deserti TaxID=2594883 RepID=A0A516KGV7_9BACI|nr:phosphate signaling complex protein PhoU [Radiobacillus deserti]QDP40615.1 phosphate signaling complex protein PhoU [Radiobacillus deserti]